MKRRFTLDEIRKAWNWGCNGSYCYPNNKQGYVTAHVLESWIKSVPAQKSNGYMKKILKTRLEGSINGEAWVILSEYDSSSCQLKIYSIDKRMFNELRVVSFFEDGSHELKTIASETMDLK